MKKIIIAVLALLSLDIASAQFSVQQKQSMPEVIWRSAMGGHNKLYRMEVGNGEYYYFIGISTTNQFDDKMLIHLGKKDKAITTLTQFYDLYAQGEIYELADDKGEKFSAQCIAMKYYRLLKRGYAGYGTIHLNQLLNMRDAINGVY